MARPFVYINMASTVDGKITSAAREYPRITSAKDRREMDRLRADVPALIDRDVVIIIDSDREKGSDLRTRLRPRGFMFVWIDKDGGVKLRKPAPWTVREITRSIDKTPLRRQEVRDRRAAQQ